MQQVRLEGQGIYACSTCNTHLANVDSVVSRAFNGQHGLAYLFDRVTNLIEGVPFDRDMTTGKHTVRDMFCCGCQNVVGWKYERAFENSQKYKEGKYILERSLLVEVGSTNDH
ncbi:hypothetical protein PILCRDRAFT_826193 [Piloderma croceum F 1598]|uniref:Protein yippee-like n=1 Tax=Piloderma croceum (strain F 1598) TaxID=765440 RepID=A0A0C3F9T1_PILCF|nr:hypothetical protein PILCRDRAFT_826193 [Piloderma croceum F 1598]